MSWIDNTFCLLRRFNTVLIVFRMLLGSVLSSMFLIDFNGMASLEFLGIALGLAVICLGIELYFKLRLPCNAAEIKRCVRHIDRKQSSIRKLLTVSTAYQLHRVRFDIMSFFYYLLIDSVLFLSVLWSLAGAILRSSGSVASMSPSAMTLLLCGFIIASLALGMLSYWVHSQNQKFSFAFLKEIEAKITMNISKAPVSRRFYLYDSFFILLGIGGAVGSYILIQWFMPFYDVLGAPYLPGLLVACVLGYSLWRLHEDKFSEIVLSIKPYCFAIVSFSTVQFLAQQVVMLTCGWSIQDQVLYHPDWMLLMTAGGVVFALVVGGYEWYAADYNLEGQLQLHLKFKKKDSLITPLSDDRALHQTDDDADEMRPSLQGY